MHPWILRTIGREATESPWHNDELIREELFSVERLEQHAETLAAAQAVTTRRLAGRPLARRLADNSLALLEAHQALAKAIGEGRPISPAAEWLVDNYHVVEEQIAEIRGDLPPGYYRQLPKLAEGPFAGFPRIFGVAWAFVAHTDSRFDTEMLCRFIHAYQRVQPLTIGELWAIAITLRIVLVENLRRAAVRIVSRRAARQRADALADRLLGIDGRAAEPVAAVLQPYEQSALPATFAAQLVQRLRDQDPRVTPALRWLEDRLAAQGTSPDAIVRDEHQRLGAMNVTVRNVITSMRRISAVDWKDLFERVSLVDAKLRARSDFALLDFRTRDRYRGAIEELARHSSQTELEVAECALLAANEGNPQRVPGGGGVFRREQDPGYHLIAGGRRAFEATIGYRARFGSWLGRFNSTLGIGGYIGSVAMVATAVLALPLMALADAGIVGSRLVLWALLGFIPAVDVAMALVNYGAMNRFGAKILPGLELSDGVPQELRTLVAVPTLLTTRAAVAEQIERLEIHHLASLDGDLYFALLSDWTDAATESAEDDEALLGAAAERIARLNRRYGVAPGGDRFLLLHRRRVWNEGEGRWIGWERKRGKLHELNRLLRGATDTTFVGLAEQPPAVPPGVRYVITLDADTRLPREAVRRLVGKMAHPLNRPRFDADVGRVVEGYAVLQPRVTPSLPIGREGSLFQRIFSSASGIDPYASAISDVYQDLFGEGSYAGKGIYDVDAFEAALAGRVPENALLSHDLFEGIFARAGLVSDIEVVEEFPSRYDVAAARQHRWARGDWQLLPWVLGPRQGAGSSPARAAMPPIGLWKMLDNLRRTLSAPASVVALVVGWTLPLHTALIWTGFVLSAIALPTLIPVLAGIVPRRSGISLRAHLRALGTDLRLALSQTALLVTFLAYQAWLMTDAIVRTLYRLFVSRRRLLEWTTAAQARFSRQLELPGFYRRMAGGVALGALAVIAVAYARSGAWPVAAPFLILWLLSPAVAQWASVSPLVAGRLQVSAADTRSLRLIARRTWRFFETFVTAADHMLPPDNFQEDPKPVLARRTSPTNLGLYLLSTVAARDFGWLGTIDMVERLEATLATMSGLQRFRGHFYNWYDTRDLRPLDPKYVSSVDSGNLAGHLIALSNACLERIACPASGPEVFAGIEDGLELTRESLGRLREDRQAQLLGLERIDNALDALGGALREVPLTPQDCAAALAELAPHAATALGLARTLAEGLSDHAGAEIVVWAEATQRSIESHRRDVRCSMPRIEPDADPAAAVRFDQATGLYQTAENGGTLADVTDLGERSGSPSPEPAQQLERRLVALATQARAMADEMEFGFLLDPDSELLAIGYLAPEGSVDPSSYDLLASEARLASFMAIAKGDVPTRHWFRLGRAVTPIGRGAALISWSGSMFEYLMPSLFMRAPAGSLLEQTSRLVVQRQMSWGDHVGVPWGISESAYNARDLEFTYQYSNFGVPGLGLKRGLGADLVVAPYATALATMVDPGGAVRNFVRIAAVGGLGRYGFYEALDYTPSRLPAGDTVAVVRAHMAHHQGMTVVAIANALLDGVMRARFHAEPIVQATELLLQERAPRQIRAVRPRVEEVSSTAGVHDLAQPAVRRLDTPHDVTPRTHLLSNGRYSVMLTGAGSGYSRWRDLAVTRWREDVTCDDWGSYVFLRDLEAGTIWSAGYQPAGVAPDSYNVILPEDRAEIVRRDGTLTTTLDVVVSPEDDAEVRRISISNAGSGTREIELTSYAELVLAPPAADSAHPAFSKLFVQTEYNADIGAILATRRRRSPDEPEIWAAHLAVVEGETVGAAEVETDRARFLGRGRELRTALAITDSRPLSGTVGTVLDPIFALRRRVRLPPGATARVAFWTLVAPSRSEALDLADKHHDAAAFERAAALAWTQAQVQLRHLGIGPDEATLFQRLAGHVLYADPTLRPASAVLRRGEGGPSALWAHGISGDLPIVLVQIDDADDVEIVRQLLRAHEYWRLKQLAVDLVILNERGPSYIQDLQVAVETAVRTSQSRSHFEGNGVGGGAFVLRADLVPIETRALLRFAARAVLVCRQGTLAAQLDRLEVTEPTPGPPVRSAVALRSPEAAAARPMLEFFNGLGGFAEDGREYVTILGAGQWTPTPWVNVIANPRFGFQVAAEGGGCTWSINSRENHLTPWSNDPVSDRPGEVIYVRDDDSGDLWGPNAQPVRDQNSVYVARHGQGYSRFEHTRHRIELELLQYVALDDPIKIARLTIRNVSGRTRRLSVTAYVEWVLGVSRASAPFLVTEIDTLTGAMLARNPWNTAFGPRVAFLDIAGRPTAWTGDRREFLGRNGSLDHPAALVSGAPLSGRVGAGLDPCGALQAALELEPDGAAEIAIFLGEAASTADAQALIARYRAADLDAVLATVVQYWDDLLGTVQVRTPDRSMDIMLNRWLLYQTLACRVWARSGFYQASGAYGFRDQLQDGMALAIARPALTREHLLRAAARQFVEGDVQHWWLPSSGQGVRTRISDDRVWLAHAVAHYVDATDDTSMLDEQLAFLEGPALRPGEHDAFFQPALTEQTATLFEHCARGLDQSLAVGTHGLPLIGTGDWNDGMNRVGEAGSGESVWLGWFLNATLRAFAPLADARGERARAARWRADAARLQGSLEQNGWDGDWYRRGFFDDGTPLGSATSEECRIDSIAQSWAVLSGASLPDREGRAMAAVERELIQWQDGLALLFTPPFDKTDLDPGYIKGYPPGIRENGGQYTHAALWSVMAFAALGEGDKADQLLSLLNPINHARTPAAVQRYKVEPYVVAADVYGRAPHVGRGGWTWYTGSAGWMHRAGIESILGLRMRGAFLHLDPCIPKTWRNFEMTVRYHSARYEIMVENPAEVSRGILSALLDETVIEERPVRLPLLDDGSVHRVRLRLG